MEYCHLTQTVDWYKKGFFINNKIQKQQPNIALFIQQGVERLNRYSWHSYCTSVNKRLLDPDPNYRTL